jgi:hypothetical protein
LKNICDIQNKSPVDKENTSVHPEQLFQASGAAQLPHAVPAGKSSRISAS